MILASGRSRSLISRSLSIRWYKAVNEPVLLHKPGSEERRKLDSELADMLSKAPFNPFEHGKKLARFSYADKGQIAEAIETAIEARKKWSRVPFEKRAEILLKAADLVSNSYRYKLLAATILGQAKTIFQAEIDAAAEMADFFRFNVQFAYQMLEYSPIDGPDCSNSSLYRPTEGFWAAIPPFNFTAIAGNLATAPILMGNAVLWKPSDTAVLSNYITYTLLLEAGIPEGVINFVPADGPTFGEVVTSHPMLAGINFTGSTKTYRHILKTMANKIELYRGYPKTIGECGGKNFHFVHPSADLAEAALGTVRSAFEYSGQKCSACSRCYVPKGSWDQFRDLLLQHHKQLKLGSPLENDTFTSAVIDKTAFNKIKSYLDYAVSNPKVEVVAGGKYDGSKGYFIEPTILRTDDPKDKLMTDDIFGPVVTVFVYEENRLSEALDLVDSTSDYALTGSIFAKDEQFIKSTKDRLIDCTGNLYINAQSTGSIVGQQPFGGARLSGTNDKAGGPQYVSRFCSPLSIKTQQKPIQHWRQAHMGSS
ncbi:Delta-1-pyrroline-5-carboxylate dehydrogenase, mitochondrial [Cichlidogyrus casuarinus]|uniref:Multifunctional fusion protein n=1 Tax=Cichlidogyrus casuarinus TaxID=1844966 RepID=A0ABD2QCQ5_9PLAT